MSENKIPFANIDTWVRFAYMVLYTVLLLAARLVISILVLVQFLFVLLSGKDNENLRNLGQGLGKWVYQTIMFLTFNTENKPFPFDEWPLIDPSEGYEVRSAETVDDAEFVEVDEANDEDVPSFTAADDANDKK
ncbi:MAG: DUF4389 domain-containing protein [Porticoccaceae bacterium]|nr:DUF4389 domain-containing protein [Porticoccaceae bacterium]